MKLLHRVSPFALLSILAAPIGSALAQNACPTVEEVFPILTNASATATQIDLLMVIDNSNSMSAYQDALARQIEVLTEQLNRYSLDFNIAIVTTDSRISLSGVRHPKLNAELSQKNPANFKKLFRLYSNVGIRGSSLEAGLDAVKTFLAKQGHAFLRPGAQFVVFNLTDTDDSEHSKVTPAELRDLILQYKSQNEVRIFNFLGDHGEHYSELRALFQGQDYFPLTKASLAASKKARAETELFMKNDFRDLAAGMVRSIPRTYEFNLKQPVGRASRASLSAALGSRALRPTESFRLEGAQKVVFNGTVEGNDELKVRYELCPPPAPAVKAIEPARPAAPPVSIGPSKPIDVSVDSVMTQVDARMNRLLDEINAFTQTREEEINARLAQMGPLSPAEVKKFIAQNYATEKKDERQLRTTLTQNAIDLLDARAKLDELERDLAILDAKKRIEVRPVDTKSQSRQLEDDVKSLDERLKKDEKPLLIVLDTSGSMKVLNGALFDELDQMLKTLPPQKSFNFATVNARGGVDWLSPSPIKRADYSHARLKHFIASGDYVGNSTVVEPLKIAIASKQYGTLLVVSDSELYDSLELIQLGKVSPLPIYGLITWEAPSSIYGQTIGQYHQEYLRKITAEQFALKRELIAYRLALKKVSAGQSLVAEVESLRKLGTESNRSFQALELEVFEKCASLTPAQIEIQIAELESSVATLENQMSAIVRQANSAQSALPGPGAPCADSAISLAQAACQSGGRAFMVSPSQPVFTIATMKQAAQSPARSGPAAKPAPSDESERARLEGEKARVIETMRGLMR